MAKYAAFISYRHVRPDADWAEWLLHDLETFPVPPELQGRSGGPTLGRLFRDQEELPAAGRLSPRLMAALEQSDALIVICSPRTPASDWVNQEVAQFIRLGRRNRIFPVLIEGSPDQSFPPALLVTRSTLTGGMDAAIPLAADVRAQDGRDPREGRARAVTMLAAAILGVGFDQLARRSAARARRVLRRSIAAGVAGVLAVGALGAGLLAARGDQRAAQDDLDAKRAATAAAEVSAGRPLLEVLAAHAGVAGAEPVARLMPHWLLTLPEAAPDRVGPVMAGAAHAMQLGPAIVPLVPGGAAAVFAAGDGGPVLVAGYADGLVLHDGAGLAAVTEFPGRLGATGGACPAPDTPLAAVGAHLAGDGLIAVDAVALGGGAAYRLLLDAEDGGCLGLWQAEALGGLDAAARDGMGAHVPGCGAAGGSCPGAALVQVHGPDRRPGAVTGAPPPLLPDAARHALEPVAPAAAALALAATRAEIAAMPVPDDLAPAVATILAAAFDDLGRIDGDSGATVWARGPGPDPAVAACRIANGGIKSCLHLPDAASPCALATQVGDLIAVCTGGDAPRLRLFDATSFHERDLPEGLTGAPVALEIDRAGWLVVTLADGGRRALPLPDLSPMEETAGPPPAAAMAGLAIGADRVAPRPDGTLARVGPDGALLWQVSPLPPRSAPEGVWGDATGAVGAARLGHDGGRAVMLVANGLSLRYLDAETGHALTPVLDLATLCDGPARLEQVAGAGFTLSCGDDLQGWQLRPPLPPAEVAARLAALLPLADADHPGFADAVARIGLTLAPPFAP